MQNFISIATAFGGRPLALLLVLCASVSFMNAQCENWNDSSDKEKAENAHVAYRNFVKGTEDFTTLSEEEFTSAFNNWKIAYEIAPAADGGRPFHFTDGREFYRAMAATATDEAKQKEYKERLIKFYDEEMECYPKGKAFLLGRKGYDMFYLQGYSLEAIEVLEKAMDAGGNASEYIYLAPLGQLLGYYFKTEAIDNKRVRELYDKASKIADFNIEKGDDYAQYWEAGKANLDASVLEYADQIFDCAYFKADLMPSFEENQENLEVMRYIINKLKEQGCPENDADIAKVQAQYDAIYATKSAEQEEIRRQNNPLYDASLMVEDGDFTGAIKRYQDAIDGAEDDEKKAQAYYQIASLQLGKLKQYGAARQNANKAASLNPGWGKPFMMIGDIYARLGSSCGDSYQQRLAVLAAIDKYNYAKRIDGSVAGDVNRRIANYRGSMPIKSEAFQRGDNAGDKISVGCGIGETVTLRF
jgi:TolA-binding protein